MLAYEADTSLHGTKSARMEQRTTQQAKDMIDKAANLLGVSPSEFTVHAAAKEARQTLAAYEMTMLNPSAHEAFFKALDATEPTDDLAALLRMHAEVQNAK